MTTAQNTLSNKALREKLRCQFYSELAPQTWMESELVEEIALARWRQRECIVSGDVRNETRIRRIYEKAMRELIALQKRRTPPEPPTPRDCTNNLLEFPRLDVAARLRRWKEAA